jgi:hypothetical protein
MEKFITLRHIPGKTNSGVKTVPMFSMTDKIKRTLF